MDLNNIWDMAQKKHLEAIEAHGILEEHRKSFAPIKDMIQK